MLALVVFDSSLVVEMSLLWLYNSVFPISLFSPTVGSERSDAEIYKARRSSYLIDPLIASISEGALFRKTAQEENPALKLTQSTKRKSLKSHPVVLYTALTCVVSFRTRSLQLVLVRSGSHWLVDVGINDEEKARVQGVKGHGGTLYFL